MMFSCGIRKCIYIYSIYTLYIKRETHEAKLFKVLIFLGDKKLSSISVTKNKIYFRRRKVPYFCDCDLSIGRQTVPRIAASLWLLCHVTRFSRVKVSIFISQDLNKHSTPVILRSIELWRLGEYASLITETKNTLMKTYALLISSWVMQLKTLQLLTWLTDNTAGWRKWTGKLRIVYFDECSCPKPTSEREWLPASGGHKAGIPMSRGHNLTLSSAAFPLLCVGPARCHRCRRRRRCHAVSFVPWREACVSVGGQVFSSHG